MRTNPCFNSIGIFRFHHFGATASVKHARGSVVWLLLAIFAFPLSGISQDEPRADESQPSVQADESSENNAVVFILDCSHSMNNELRLPAGGANVQPRAVPRLTVAKRALEEVLTQVAERNQARGSTQTRIGVRFYGHRVGWVARVTPPRMAIQPKYEDNTPGGLRPSRDVELIHRLGTFELADIQALEAELQRIEPWGETPLFLSLEQALADFDNLPPNFDKSIIVITDGGNYQFEPTTTLNDVVEAWRADGDVRIHILGLDMGGPNLAAAREEHTRLARTTGGTFSQIASGNELIQKLRELLNFNDEK